MPNFATASTSMVLFVAIIVWSVTAMGADNTPAISGPQASILNPLKTCETTILPQRKLDIFKFRDGQRVTYEFEIPGLHVLLEAVADSPRRTEGRLVRFMLDYDPALIGRLSPYRSVLGDKPMQYDENDLRLFSHAWVAEFGSSWTLFLRLPDDPKKEIDHGPLLHIAMETGLLYGYAAGTDVDGEMANILRGSLSAVGNFVSGLTTEIRFMMRNRKPEKAGQFFIENSSAATEALPSPTRLLENGN